jgi:hypothetical protein
MHKEILTEEQLNLLPTVGKFSRKFGLVGGTAIALQIGHRQSIDFDLFTDKPFNNLSIKRKILQKHTIQKTYKDEEDQYTFLINGVQFTFFNYPFKIDFSKNFEGIVKIPDLLTLAAMKVFALGQRAKWKDYVDLYFIIKKYHGLEKISKKAKEIFGGAFNERIIREQLAYFDDINYSEEVIFMPGYEVDEKTIKKDLVEFSSA